MMKIKMRVFCWLLSMFCAIRTEALGPAMSLVVQLGASVTLPCSVDTPLPLHLLEVQWRREESGTLVHMFQEGESRPESQSPAYSGRADFFSEEISKGNFSLLLRNVTTEDKGLYKCVVQTEHESHETEVTIDIGFSTWHLCVLGLTTAAAGFAVISCIPALLRINKEKKEEIKEVKSNTAVLLYCLQVSVPCILMSIAFAIWGYIESSFAEAYTCSAINLSRILVIFKVAPYVLPGMLLLYNTVFCDMHI
ncbi:erythroid membrane-associated protein-like [Anguilla anguilla]|uniref:erythroid membrane-associated protein-like n=1 Tax=Anguilla anguilla TaxID=7936 RepID=UPI0015B1C4C4|nr:erythroid membrane-associated protein-like [Anguilla anguilla]